MIEDALNAGMCFALAYLSLAETDRMVRWALWFQRRFPEAFSSRLAERSWYPRLLRALGGFLLLSGVLFTLEIFAHLLTSR